jgi:hypothetical protein
VSVAVTTLATQLVPYTAEVLPMPSSIFTRNARTSSVALALLATATALLAGCGGSDSTSPNPPAPPPPPPPPADVWSSVVQRTWSVPSQTEAYKCHTELVSSDKYFTGFRLASPVAAQTELYVVMRPTVQQVGDYDCDLAAIGGGEAIYIAGSGTTQLELTGGKGVHVASGQYLELVVHLVNTTSASVAASTKVEGRVVAAKDVTTPIDMFFAGRLNINLPADGNTYVENEGCEFGAESHFVAELPLMRALGKHFALTATVSAVNHTLFDLSFDPQHITYSSLTSDFDMPTGARLTASCTFVNNTGAVVNFGESSQDEICLDGVYRYPPKPPTSVSPYDCALGNTI